MPVVKYDVSDVETGGGGADVPVGLRRGNIVGITHRSKNANGSKNLSDLEVVVDFGAGYQRKYTYVKLPDDPVWDKTLHGWKLREFTDAVGLPAKGGVDTAPAKLKQLYKPVNVRITADTDLDGNPRNKIKNLFLPVDDGVEELDEVTPSEDAQGVSATGSDGDGPYGREEMETWSNDDLKSYAEELGIEVPGGRGAKAKLLDALVMAEEEVAEGGDGEPEVEGDASLLEGLSDEILAELKPDPAYYEDWSDDEIKEFIVDLDLGAEIAVTGRGWRAKANQGIADFAERAQGGGTNGDGGEPAAVEDNYEDEAEWPTEDLKAEIDDRNAQGAEITVAGRATRAKMIEALRADDKAAEPF